MKSVSLTLVCSAAILAAVGCKKEEPAPKPVPATPTAQAPAAPVAPAAPAQDVLKDAQAQGKAAVDGAVAQGKSAANDLTAAATQKLEQAVTYLKENKVDAADKLVSGMESNKASLPAAIQQRLVDVRKMVDSAKAVKATGLALPKF